MKVTFLGTGTSQGVPMIGCTCAVCQSKDSRDQRLRCSILIEDDEQTLLFDTPPDLRTQLLRANLRKLDAVLITHAHADHIMGFDDLRRFCEISGKPMPVYAGVQTMGRLREIFYYTFNVSLPIVGYLQVEPHEITMPFCIGSLEITPLIVPHGGVVTMGFLVVKNGVKKLVYMPDCAAVPDSIRQIIQGVGVLIIDGLRDKPHPTHLSIAQAIEVSQAVQAGTTYLTHLAHDKTHQERCAELPAKVCLSYDGLVLKI